jgi:hypothetical protein
MTERERWIVYPLLFFALGAALRDKFTHTVQTDELRAGRILCEELEVLNGLSAKAVECGSVTVFDPKNQSRPLAVLTSTPVSLPNGANKNLGSLYLTDSDGRELFGLRDDEIRTRVLKCEGVAVMDPERPNRRLAALGYGSRPGKDGKPERYGILELNNRVYNRILGNPVRAPEGKVAANRKDEAAPAAVNGVGGSAANGTAAEIP